MERGARCRGGGGGGLVLAACGSSCAGVVVVEASVLRSGGCVHAGVPEVCLCEFQICM